MTQVNPSRSLSHLSRLISAGQTAAGNPQVVLGAMFILLVAAPSLLAPYIFTTDPIRLEPAARLFSPSGEHWFGTDMFGRDLYSRTVYGGRTSLVVGFSVAGLAVTIGVVLGALAGYVRIFDAVLMRIMDGLMAIPGLLLAIALVAVTGASLATVIVAITIPEIPRVVRLVRSIVLSIREEAYVEAAILSGTSVPVLLYRHIIPNTFAALVVLATYICAAAILLEAALGFLGAGIPPEIPSWGNMISEGRVYFQIAPWIIFFPSFFLTVTVLGVNILGDGLRDTLDPRLARKM